MLNTDFRAGWPFDRRRGGYLYPDKRAPDTLVAQHGFRNLVIGVLWLIRT